jgi:AraC-like DNA-binding protein
MPRIVFAGKGHDLVLSLPVHHHEPWIVILYMFGVGEAAFETARMPFRRGTVLCVPPRMAYSETSQRGFNSTFIAVDSLDLDNERPHSFFDGSGQWLRIAELIVETFNAQQQHSRSAAEHLFDALVVCLLPTKDAAHPQVARLREIIHQRWAEADFQIADAMGEIPVSPAHLRRTFASQIGVPPVTYLLKHRVQHAQRLLAMGGFSIKQISRMCGFRDPYYFSRAFRGVAGRSPSAWKESRRK